MQQNHRAGFTLIELMIVVSIIAIIAAMALPSLAASRRAANEANCISALRMVTSVNELYRNRFGSYALAADDWVLANLVPHNADGELLVGTDDYDFSYDSDGSVWSVSAVPRVPGVTADRAFYVDITGVIRFSTTGAAGPGSDAID